MTTHIITISPKQLVDIEGAYIPVSAMPDPLQLPHSIRDTVAFSTIKTGRFRRFFNRHTLAYKH